ncbi:MAG TPA: putative zinc-binding metallopeptidase [Acidimicrobiales bacterium]
MRDLSCPNCAERVFFENDLCLACGTSLGFEASSFSMVAVGADDQPDGPRRCANAELDGCNWVVPPGVTGRCRSCALTRTRPPAEDTAAHESFMEAEAAKRRLVAQLVDLRLPIVAFTADEEGLAFDLLSSRFDQVMIGHEDGLITLDLAEADDAHRERVRTDMGEAYRTLLGHFRHEVGHYYWMVLVRDTGRIEQFRELFGDERIDYRKAVSAHYGGSGPAGWENAHVSAYATMHPWEDWAETFAHILHIRDTIQTAIESGVSVADPDHPGERVPVAGVEQGPFEELVRQWITLSGALNMLNRSMGEPDLYPFVLAPTVIDKLAYVDELVRNAASDVEATSMVAPA